ncbi:MAG TPA: DUF2254 family protein, partial [Acidimicrobiales bacterium]|nr:DUF2254 family protein [Acidimicrobiales bacterium]
MVMFLRLVGRTTQSLRVATVLRELGRDGERIVRRTYPDQLTDSVAQAEHPDADGVAGAVRTIVHRFDSGVLQSIGIAEIVDHACAVDMTVELVPRIGDVVATGSDIFRVRGGGGPADDARLQRAIAVGDERTIRQDPEFVFRLLADVSIKALSLAVNDPTTAVQALDQIELLLRDLGGRRLDTGVVRDAHGIVRIRRKVPSWEDFVTLALVETRQYGVASTQVTRRLRAILISLRDLVAEPRRRVLEAELAAIDTSIIHRFESEYDQRLAKVADTQGLG